MRIRARTAVRALAALALLAAGAVVAGLVAVDKALSRADVGERIEAAAGAFLGRPLEIGSVEWRGWREGLLVGNNVRLWEDEARTRLMASAPSVEARLSLLSIRRLAFGVTELRFVRPAVTLRRPEGKKLNVASMIDDIRRRARGPRRRVGTLLFNWFTVEDGSLDYVSDGPVPVNRLSRVNARGKLAFDLGSAAFPFEADGALHGSSSGTVRLSGALGAAPVFRAVAQDAPLAWLGALAPPLASWEGVVDGAAEFKKRRGGWRGEFSLAARHLRRADGPEMPALRLEGRLDPRRTPAFSGIVESSATRVAVATKIDRGARRIELQVDSPRSDLMELVRWSRAVAASAAAARDAGETKGWAIAARLTLSSCAIPSDQIDEAALSVAYAPGEPARVAVDRMIGLGGSATGYLTYDATRSSDALSWTFRAVDLDANRFTRVFAPPGPVSGRCDTSGAMSSAAGAAFSSSLNGRADVSLRDGALEDIPAVLKTFSKLNLTSLFNELKGSKRRSRLPFNSATARIRFENGKARTEEPFVLENKTIQMGFMGTVDIPANRVEGSIVVNVLTVADEIIGNVPGLRDVLLGDKKSFVPIFVKVEGPLGDPEVKVQALKSIASPLWSTVGRIFGLPAALIKAVSGDKD